LATGWLDKLCSIISHELSFSFGIPIANKSPIRTKYKRQTSISSSEDSAKLNSMNSNMFVPPYSSFNDPKNKRDESNWRQEQSHLKNQIEIAQDINHRLKQAQHCIACVHEIPPR
jgi:hypothetical protein